MGRPDPAVFGLHNVCEITARRDSDSMARIISFSAAGNTSMMRSTVLAAEGMRCAEHQVAGFGAVIANRIVSRSRISPTG